ncbi:STAS domain-containing protein [Phytomonospora sp. NPDC050363]|uniref:STAS domain-containing protein n=1 Tax=Phytomonospora sp. NPDC050363 TaxID=3155642 RepID=UPI003403C17D
MILPEHGVGFAADDRSDCRVITLAGEVDVAMSGAQEAEFLALLDGAPGGIVVLDFSEVAFCDSTGLGILLRAVRHMGSVSGQIRIAAPQDHIARLITMNALDRALPMYDTVDEAAAAPLPSA